MKLFWTTSLHLHSLFPWNHQKIIGFQQKLFFLITIRTKGSILYVLQGFEYTNEYGCKILYWWELETKETKWCIGSKRVMPSLCIHIFFALFHLFHFSFPTLHFIIHSIRTAIVKNKCCVFLVSTLNDFCFIENAVSVSSNSYQLRHISNPVNYRWWSFLKKLAMFSSCWLFCHKSYRTDFSSGSEICL